MIGGKIFVVANKSIKKVLHFIPGDGPNSLVQSICLASDLNIKILTLYTMDTTVPDFCIANKIEVESLGFKEKDTFAQLKEFIKYLHREKPSMVFAHSFYPSFICSVARLFCWKTVFIIVRHHNRVHILSKNRKAIFLDQYISQVTSHTVAVSDAVKETLVEQGCNESKISVIINGLPKPPTLYTPIHTVGKDRPFKLVALGRIDWQKNYEAMLMIISTLRRSGIELELNILGNGSSRYLAQLKRLQKELDILDCVTWSGRRSDIYKYLNDADLFIHTAIDEACPLVLIETIMFGIPIISSNLGGCRDVLKGFYAGRNPTNINEFCEGVVEVLRDLDSAREYAKSITDAAVERFNPIRMQNEYTSLSLQLL